MVVFLSRAQQNSSRSFQVVSRDHPLGLHLPLIVEIHAATFDQLTRRTLALRQPSANYQIHETDPGMEMKLATSFNGCRQGWH
jgi:hypothetical protein